MSDPGDRGKRPGGTPDGRRPQSGRPAKGAPEQSRGPRREGDRPSAARKDGDRPRPAAKDGERQRPARSNGDRPRPAAKDGERRLWTAGGKPARGDRDARERETPEDRDPFGTRSVRPHHEEPIVPDDVSPGDLDRIARNELKTLSKENAEGVAKHLVMAARLIESDPALAHQHALSAARRAGRIGVVRETLAITAYATGDFALALRELRTHRRITGSNDQLPMMVDSERGLARPEKALELGRSVTRSTLPVPVQVELAIAMSGARLDLGQAEAALSELQIPQLDPSTAFSWSPALFDAYATVLEELGRQSEADEWFARSDRAAAVLDTTEGGDSDDIIEVIEEDIDWVDAPENGEETAGE